MSQWIVIFGLVAMILLHELGHLLSARATGTRATTYSFGFGPVLWRRRWRNVEWRWSLLPLGGYVRIPAIMPPDLENDRQRALTEWDLSENDQEKITQAKTSAQLYDAMMQIKPVEKIDAPAQAGFFKRNRLTRGEEWTRLSDEHAPDAYYLASWPRRTLVILAGSSVNIIGGALLLLVTLWLYSPLYATTWKVSHVAGKTDRALIGQRVLQLNEQGLTYSDQRKVQNLDSEAHKHPGQSLLLLSSGRIVAVNPGGATISIAASHLAGRRSDVPFSKAMSQTGDTVQMLVSGTANVATRAFVDQKVRRQTGTVIGAVNKAPDASDFLPQYLAIISIAIGLVNLLPLLPLDGGHFVMSTLRVLRVPLHRSAYFAYGAMGMAFVLGLFAIGLSNDIRAF